MSPTPSEMLEQVQASRARFLAALEGVNPEVLETEEVVGVWTPRDVAGNVSAWNWELLWSAQAALNGKPVEHHPIADPEAYNQSQAAQRNGRSWAETKAELDKSFDDSLALIGTLTQEQFDQAATAPWDEPTTIGALFAVIPEHTDEHAGQLESWRATGERQ